MLAAMLQAFRAIAAGVAVVLWSMTLTMVQGVATLVETLKRGFTVLFADGVGVTPQLEALARTTQSAVSPGVEMLAEGFGRALSRLVSMIGAGLIGVVVASGFEAQDCQGLFECRGALSVGESFGLVAFLLAVGFVFAYAEVILAERLPKMRASSGSSVDAVRQSETCRCRGDTGAESAVNAAMLDEVLAQLSRIQDELSTPWWKKVVRRAR